MSNTSKIIHEEQNNTERQEEGMIQSNKKQQNDRQSFHINSSHWMLHLEFLSIENAHQHSLLNQLNHSVNYPTNTIWKEDELDWKQQQGKT